MCNKIIALGLFRRFYYTRGLMQANPASVLKSSIVLAAKIGEINFDPNALYKKLELKAEGKLIRIHGY